MIELQSKKNFFFQTFHQQTPLISTYHWDNSFVLKTNLSGSTGYNNCRGLEGSSLRTQPTDRRTLEDRRWAFFSCIQIVNDKSCFMKQLLKVKVEINNFTLYWSLIVSATGFAEGEEWKWWIKGVKSFQGERDLPLYLISKMTKWKWKWQVKVKVMNQRSQVLSSWARSSMYQHAKQFRIWQYHHTKIDTKQQKWPKLANSLLT